MTIASLKKRITLGRPLLPSEHQFNFDTIEAFVNALEGSISARLEPDGTLADNAVDRTAVISNSIITLAKLANLTPKVAIGSDAAGVPSEVAGSNGQYLRKNASTGLLEFGDLPAAVSTGSILGVYYGPSVLVPDFSVDVTMLIFAEALLRGRIGSAAFVAEKPVNAGSTPVAAVRWWITGGSNLGWYSQGVGLGLHTRLADSGTTSITFGSLVAIETSVLSSSPDVLATSYESIAALVLATPT